MAVSSDVEDGASAPEADPEGRASEERPRSSKARDRATQQRAPLMPAQDAAFLLEVGAAFRPVMGRVARVYGQLLEALRRRRLTAWMARDHFLFFALSAAGLPLLMPRTQAMIAYAADHYLFGLPVVRPALEGWPAMPSIVLPAVVASLLVFFLPRSARLAALTGFSVAAGLAFGYLDLPSLLVFIAFASVAFSIIRLPVSRPAAVAMLCCLALVLLFVSLHWFKGQAIATIGTFQVTLIPMLWYSAYEHKMPRRPLAFKRLVAYLYLRFFGGPVFTHADVFSVAEGQNLAQTRFRGVKALYIACLASLATAGAQLVWRDLPLDELTGLTLLAVSYIGYVGESCQLVLAFNLVIGVLRLFGIPLRDNFNYWLLARTPNEHWQRWNLLFREWVITFVFFPIMRSKRWLFAAIMCSLLVSGFLHTFAALILGSANGFGSLLYMSYWVLNGLAIYAVVKIPMLFPRLVVALGMKGSLAWSTFGVVATSSFYGILHGIRSTCDDWADVVGYFGRLF